MTNPWQARAIHKHHDHDPGLQRRCGYLIGALLRKRPDVSPVRVSLNEGKAFIALGPGSSITVAHIRVVIRHNGFTPKEARAMIVGRVVPERDRLWVDTSSGRFMLEADSKPSKVRRSQNAAAGNRSYPCAYRNRS